jgi:ABC-2 type transport system permease protein
MSYVRFRAVFVKEVLHIVRDWRSLAMALAVPVLLLTLFGYALTLDVDRIPTVIHDQDASPRSRELAALFDGSRYFAVKPAHGGYAGLQRLVDRNEALLGVVIPRGFAARISAGEPAPVQLLLDGSDSNTASIAAGYAETLVLGYSAAIRRQRLIRQGAGDLKTPIDARVRVLYNNELKSKNFIVPGLIAVILMIVAALLTSLTIAREWENGTMEQLLSTPVRPNEVLTGKLCAYFILGMVDMGIALALGVHAFGVPLRGGVGLLVLSGAVFLFGALCWGIFLSTVARSQLLAYQAALLTSFLPSFLLSGFIFSIENMPAVIQQITRIVPARYFVTILQGIFLKGAGLKVLWMELFLLALYAAIVFLLASRGMRRKIA